MPRRAAFTGTCFWSIWSQYLRDPGPPSVLNCPPQKGPTASHFFSTNHGCNAPTCSFHQKLFLVDLVIVAQRSRPSRAPLSAPTQKKTHCFRVFQPSNSVMPRPVAFTRSCFWSIWSQQLRDLGPSSVLHYPPPKKGPMFHIFFQPSKSVMPRRAAFTGTCFWLIWS